MKRTHARRPFFYKGVYHIFMQQSFPWVKGWNGAIGWGHMVSTDLAHWKEISSFTGYIDAFVPRKNGDGGIFSSHPNPFSPLPFPIS